tara:strand:+ start:141 stop:902 length:762 start_codon:yes stop_codon:yes gene_type:complete
MSRLFPIQNLVDALRADATLARDVYAYLEKEFPQFHPDYSAYREVKRIEGGDVSFPAIGQYERLLASFLRSKRIAKKSRPSIPVSANLNMTLCFYDRAKTPLSKPSAEYLCQFYSVAEFKLLTSNNLKKADKSRSWPVGVASMAQKLIEVAKANHFDLIAIPRVTPRSKEARAVGRRFVEGHGILCRVDADDMPSQVVMFHTDGMTTLDAHSWSKRNAKREAFSIDTKLAECRLADGDSNWATGSLSSAQEEG